ncbi:28879_t:CDS:2 [Gigaspora margarita]|uniref:28879_t:CDS:1 n=1 Tax=Gigaspora margarita TaxID=4874 RepID=A0ABM8VX92_GIGMA|nr:28879_t:CDS:2 [Gigaspora margarita]
MKQSLLKEVSVETNNGNLTCSGLWTGYALALLISFSPRINHSAKS